MALSESTILEAFDNIRDHIIKTPLEYSYALSKHLGVDVYLKLEFLQKTGSFKYRGALHSLITLKKQGIQSISTCSAGNHGKGVAYAAKELGMDALIFVPSTVDEAKYQGMLTLGAEVIKSPYPGYDQTEIWAREQAQLKRLPFLSAFNDDNVMAGNGGTLALEIMEELPAVKTLVFPVGGGGLGAGLSFYAQERYPDMTLIGCQHQDSAGLALSLEQNTPITQMPPITTVAGGLEGGVGDLCFDVLKNRITRVALVNEEEIIQGWLWCLHHHQYLIEPTSAVTLACALHDKLGALASPTVIILSGRNVGYTTIQSLIVQHQT
ncbi:MAG: threonine ammonia-lyase [Candidatus Nucleicultricaceae bacterium]